MKFGLEQFLVRQAGLVLGDERGRCGSAEGILNDLAILRGTKQDADRGPFVRFLDVPVQRLQIELQLAEMLGLELVRFQLKSDRAIQRPIEEEQIQGEVPAADLEQVLAADEAEVSSQLDEELFEILNQSPFQVLLPIGPGQVEEFDQVAIFEDRPCPRMQFCQQR